MNMILTEKEFFVQVYLKTAANANVYLLKMVSSDKTATNMRLNSCITYDYNYVHIFVFTTLPVLAF